MLRAGKTCKNGLAGPLRRAKGAAEEREELQEPTLGNADNFTAHLQNLVGPEAKGQALSFLVQMQVLRDSRQVQVKPALKRGSQLCWALLRTPLR